VWTYVQSIRKYEHEQGTSFVRFFRHLAFSWWNSEQLVLEVYTEVDTDKSRGDQDGATRQQ
jgi:hypothetical protein